MRDPVPAGNRTVAPLTGAPAGPAVPHSTRPSYPTTVPGTRTGTTSLSTGRPVDPNAPAQVRAQGQDHSLARTGRGTDSPRHRSDEAGTAALSPQLVLTFGAE
ncbi:hypothetical protein [Streptomyces sp. NBC_01217]|uniref:hypothetical protein n=1 Tax=Streptomyces sp. NBC_01217 TaxID=2903779 RepID=UPI002E141291|nr:hypothetical protein OG507_03950 [Streptomyces sp. NBC_01217]